MDINFYNKCTLANLNICEVYKFLKSNSRNIVREIKDIKNVRIINTYIDTTKDEENKNIYIYPGFSMEIILINNLIIEISCPPENNDKNKITIEIDIINKLTCKIIKDKYLIEFPITVHKYEEMIKEIYDLSTLKISLIKN